MLNFNTFKLIIREKFQIFKYKINYVRNQKLRKNINFIIEDDNFSYLSSDDESFSSKSNESTEKILEETKILKKEEEIFVIYNSEDEFFSDEEDSDVSFDYLKTNT